MATGPAFWKDGRNAERNEERGNGSAPGAKKGGGEEEGVEQDDGGAGGEIKKEGEGNAEPDAGGGDERGDPQGGMESAGKLQRGGGGKDEEPGNQQRADDAHAEHDDEGDENGHEAREALGPHTGDAGLGGIKGEREQIVVVERNEGHDGGGRQDGEDGFGAGNGQNIAE